MKKLTYLFLIIFAIQSAGFALGTTAGTNILNAPRAVTLNFSDQNNNGAITRNSTNTVTSNVKAVYGLSGTFTGGQINQTTGAGVEVGFTTHTISNQSNTAITINANKSDLYFSGNAGTPENWSSRFDNSYGMIDSWPNQSATPMTVGLYEHTANIYNHRIYIIGGYGSGGEQEGIYTATVNANGSLSNWTTQANAPIKLFFHTANIHNGRIYLVGGKSNFNAVSSVYSSTINANGTLTTWISQQSLPQGIMSHTTSIYNGRIYVTGGNDGFNFETTTVYVATINANGSISTWTTHASDGQQLPQPLASHTASVYNGRLYVIGGQNASDVVQSTVYSATLNSNGTLSNWVSQQSLPVNLVNHAAIIKNGKIYIFGGQNASFSNQNQVYVASINANGSITSWSTLPSLPIAIYAHTANADSEKIIITGGYFNGAGTSVYLSQFIDDQSINASQDTNQNFHLFNTPASNASNGSQGFVSINYFLSAALPTPNIGTYTGFNGTSYGGSPRLSALTTTTVSGPDLQIVTRSMQFIAPAGYTGPSSALVPGAKLVYTTVIKNFGSAAAVTANITKAIQSLSNVEYFYNSGTTVGFGSHYGTPNPSSVAYSNNSGSTYVYSPSGSTTDPAVNAIRWTYNSIAAGATVTLNYAVIVK